MTSTTNLSCGNCQATVALSDIVCPNCGVLLAAYAPVSGAGAPEATIPDAYLSPPPPPPVPDATSPADVPPTAPSVPEPVSPPVTPVTSVQHRPASQSPIGDALRRSQQSPSVDADPGTILADMADGNDELSDMADGQDELTEMASGRDELARMATGTNVTFAEEVEAELRGAHVDFTGAAPSIKSDAVTILDPGTASSQAEEHTPPVAAAPPPTRDRATRHEPIAWVEPGRPVPPARRSDASQARTQRNASQSRTQPSLTQSRTQAPPPLTTLRARDLGLWIPFGLLICVVLSVGNNVNGVAGFALFVFVALVFVFLLKSTRATSRKTTSMPRDPASKK